MSSQLERDLLSRIKNAEDQGSPITQEQLGVEKQGSTFEDLWSEMYICIVGQQHRFVCTETSNSQYILTPRGHARLSELIKK